MKEGIAILHNNKIWTNGETMQIQQGFQATPNHLLKLIKCLYSSLRTEMTWN